MKALIITALAALLITGCASRTPKDWSATGGSRADGVVRLSYEVTEWEEPVLSEQQAISLSAQRCKSWGYTSAEAFGGVTRQCNQMGGFSGCMRWVVSKDYQCTGSK